MLVVAPAHAADVSVGVGINLPGVAVGVPVPVAPPPVVVPAPVYVAPPPVVYGPAPGYYYKPGDRHYHREDWDGDRHGHRRGWERRHGEHGHQDRD
jgi:hypothetical protein